MKKLLVGALCAALAMTTVTPTFASGLGGSESYAVASKDSTKIPNPLVYYDTIEDVQKAVRFEFKVPAKLPSGYKIDNISVIANEIIQVIYKNKQKVITYRTAKITKDQKDISGDYNSYKQKKTVTVNKMKVTMKGNKNKVSLVQWKDKTYIYSLHAAPQVTKNQAKAIVKGNTL